MPDPKGNETSGKEAPQNSFLVAPPSITMPKGGGAIRGIGEKFAANPVTGTGSMSVPIATSPGRSGFGPQLSLSYDSGASYVPFGFGWSLSLPSFTRKTDKGLPRYEDADESDVFILSGSEDLVPEFRHDHAREPPDNWILEDGTPVVHEDTRESAVRSNAKSADHTSLGPCDRSLTEPRRQRAVVGQAQDFRGARSLAGRRFGECEFLS